MIAGLYFMYQRLKERGLFYGTWRKFLWTRMWVRKDLQDKLRMEKRLR